MCTGDLNNSRRHREVISKVGVRYSTAACILSLLLFVAACSEPRSDSLETNDKNPIEVETISLKPVKMERAFSTVGTVVPAEEFEISADVSALVREVRFDEGQTVEKGDTLLILDDSKFRLRLKTANANLSSARASLEEARANHIKNESVFERGAISEQQFQQSKSRLQSASASVDAAVAERQLAQKDLDATRIVSPVSGLVTERNIEPGKNISPQLYVGRISSSDAHWVETYVSQKDVNLLSKGMDCEVRISGVTEGDSVLRARVDIIANTANNATGNYRVRVTVNDSDGRVRDGMMARVNFSEVVQEGVLSIPRVAVVDYHREFVVFKYLDGQAVQVAPTLAVGNQDHYAVVDGLGAGDEVIVTNVSSLADGTEVIKKI